MGQIPFHHTTNSVKALNDTQDLPSGKIILFSNEVECCTGAGAVKSRGISAGSGSFFIKFRGNNGSKSAFCGSPAGAG